MPQLASKSPQYHAPISNETAGSVPSQSTVSTVRVELSLKAKEYQTVRDCVAGEVAVKEAGAEYLPVPETTTSTSARYQAYLRRAVFYNVAKRTLAGLTGQVSMKPATIVNPTGLNPVVKDATGSGVSLEELGLFLVSEVLQLGRGGVLADFPVRPTVTTREELNKGTVRPNIIPYTSEQIINWRTTSIDGNTVLTLVVLFETIDEPVDEFSTKQVKRYRVLRLRNGKYTVQTYTQTDAGEDVSEELSPKDSTGAELTEIPFKFIGAINNDTKIDSAPLYDLCSLNIAHYRNSADYEEALFMCGQPTPVVAGIDQSWYENVLNKTINLGSRGGIPLPEGATADLLEMEANNAAKEGMTHKEEQMKALGAKLIEVTQVQKTATEATQDEVGETSVLHRIVTNVNNAVRWAFEWCAIFTGATTVNRDATDDQNRTIDFKLNTDFDFSGVSAEEVNAAISAWQQSAITFSEMREVLTKAGVATLDVDTAKKEIRDDMGEEMKMNAAMGLNPDGSYTPPSEDQNPPGGNTPPKDDEEV